MEGIPSRADVKIVAESLDVLAPRARALLSRERPGAIATYLRLLDDAKLLNVASDEAASFRRTFNGFYGVRRNADWRRAFYRVFEDSKRAEGDATARFAAAMRALQASHQRVEASFCSKLVATLDATAPIIDSVVRTYLAKRVASPTFGRSVEQAVAYHRWLNALFQDLALSAAACRWADEFEVLLGTQGRGQVHAIKRLDFLIWAGAPRS